MSVGGGVWWKKTTVEECKSIDIRKFKRWGSLHDGHSGEVDLQNGFGLKSSIGYSVESDSIRLIYNHSSDSVSKECDYRVQVDYTPCNYGNSRPWFLCPVCSGRCAKLYLAPGSDSFLCRNCHGLTYHSRQERLSSIFGILFAILKDVPELQNTLYFSRSPKKRRKAYQQLMKYDSIFRAVHPEA